MWCQIVIHSHSLRAGAGPAEVGRAVLLMGGVVLTWGVCAATQLQVWISHQAVQVGECSLPTSHLLNLYLLQLLVSR